MYLCYIDESGTSSIPGNTSHFILVGVSIPIWHWKDADREITRVLGRYGLQEEELHTAWLLRKYIGQSKIPNFVGLDRATRRSAVQKKEQPNFYVSNVRRIRNHIDGRRKYISIPNPTPI
jgi:hypothetical protein